MHGEAKRTINGEQRRQVVRQAKKLEGNPAHPISRGKICARGQAGVQVLYNPDRIQSPMRRVGPRGSGRFQAISWEEALTTLAEGLQKNRAAQPNARILWIIGPPVRGHRQELFRTFLTQLQPASLVKVELFSDEAVRRANGLNTGHDEFHSYDLEGADYWISFGAWLLEAGRSPVRFNRGLGSMRQDRPGQRGKFVHIEPRLSLTAANADEWLAAKPGTEGCLALGLAHVITKGDLFDREFVERSTQGFGEFKSLVEEYTPARVSTVTGIRGETILRVAREFAQHRPAFAIAGDAATAHVKGVASALTVNALNALVGAYGLQGAIRSTPHRPPDGGVGTDTALAEISSIQQQPVGTVAALFLSQCDPIHSLPASFHVREAFDRVPLVVSFSPFLDDSSLHADLLLPDHTSFERWGDDVPEPGVGIAVRTLMQPVVKPLYDTRDTGDVVLQLAKQLGGTMASAMPWTTFEEYLKVGYERLYPQLRTADQHDFAAFWEAVLTKGGVWGDEPSSPFQFGGAAKRFDFRARQIGAAEMDRPPIFVGEINEFPYLLQIYQSNSLGDGNLANLPWLQELADPLTGVVWNSWIEISPQTAERLDLSNGDVLQVRSAHGQLEAPAYIYPGVGPDAVAMPMGQGHRDFGRYARSRGVNPVELLAPATEAVTGALAWLSTRVSLRKTGRTVRLANLLGEPREHDELHLSR